jgi:hypothetical protein
LGHSLSFLLLSLAKKSRRLVEDTEDANHGIKLLSPNKEYVWAEASKERVMRKRKESKLYQITLVFQNDVTRVVRVKAVSRETAEKRALKHNRHAIGVKRV